MELLSITSHDDLVIGLSILLGVLLLSTIYLFMSQNTGTPQGTPITNSNWQLPGITTTRRTPPTGSEMSFKISHKHLTPQQLKLDKCLYKQQNARILCIDIDTILENKELASRHWKTSITPSILNDLLQIADVYIFCQLKAANTEIQNQITSVIMKGLEELNGEHIKSIRQFSSHRILFATSEVGKIAFARQLEPHIYVDGDTTTVLGLERHIPQILHVTSENNILSMETIPGGKPILHKTISCFTTYIDKLRST